MNVTNKSRFLLQPLQRSMKIPMIPVGGEFLDTSHTASGVLPLFIIEGSTRFQLEVSGDEGAPSPHPSL